MLLNWLSVHASVMQQAQSVMMCIAVAIKTCRMMTQVCLAEVAICKIVYIKFHHVHGNNNFVACSTWHMCSQICPSCMCIHCDRFSVMTWVGQ